MMKEIYSLYLIIFLKKYFQNLFNIIKEENLEQIKRIIL